MSASNSGGAQDLTQDKQVLHHHVAIIRKDLEAYHTYFRSKDRDRSKEYWKDLFKSHLACVIPIIYFHKPFSSSSRINH
jgi:hypothetical protein